jgi:hypothetical protein
MKDHFMGDVLGCMYDFMKIVGAAATAEILRFSRGFYSSTTLWITSPRACIVSVSEIAASSRRENSGAEDAEGNQDGVGAADSESTDASRGGMPVTFMHIAAEPRPRAMS